VTDLRRDALEVLRGWTAPDEHQEALRREYVGYLGAHTDAMWRTAEPDHLTAGALIVSHDRDQVLLTLHAKAGRWFHTGGHCEPEDTTLAGAAAREATEESGVSGLVVDPVPVHLDAHVVAFCTGHEQVRHLDVRFVAQAPPEAVHAVSDESLDVRWWPVADLPTDDPEMVRLVELAVARAQTTGSSTGS
jgi:8-oxo-dGTP pyrophosphatase MutT (NUDIX family)